MWPFLSMGENADAAALFARLCAFSISFCFAFGANVVSRSYPFNETDPLFDFFDYFKYWRAEMILARRDQIIKDAYIHICIHRYMHTWPIKTTIHHVEEPSNKRLSCLASK